MKRTLLFTPIIFLTVFLAFLNVPAQVKKPVEPPVTSAPNGRTAQTVQNGMLYKISGKGLKKPSYIFGTIHIICPKDMFSMEKLAGFIDQTGQLVMELDMDDPVEMRLLRRGIVIPGGKALTEFLTPEEYAKVDELFKNTFGLSVEIVKTIKPVMLEAIIIASPKVLGCAPPASYETSFVQAAAEKKKPIIGLETTAFQSALLDKTPIDKQAKALYKIALDPQKTFDDFKNLMTAYKAQDITKLQAEVEKQTAENTEFADELLNKRNKAWIPKIEKAIKAKPSFIAVGGGHLGGDNGVIQLLKTRGYTVQAVKL